MPVALACLLLGASLPACGRSDTSPPRTTHVTIAVPGAGVPLGPLIYSLTSARLLRPDQTGRPQPDVIESWTVSTDGLTWTFRIRQGLRLVDAQRPATTADIVSLIREAVAASDVRAGIWDVTSVDETGPDTIDVRLSRPTSLLLDSLSVWPAIDAGLYRLDDPEAAEPTFSSVPQPGHPAPAIGRIAVKRFDTARAAVAALLREDVDVLYESPSDVRRVLEAEDGVHVFPHVKPYVVTLGINHRHSILARREVRLALNKAVDRVALVDEVAEGMGVPAADILWHQHWSQPHAADTAFLRVDREEAERLLDEAGLPRRASRTRVAPRFRIACLVLNNPMMLRVAGRLQQAYGDIGVTLDIEALELPALAPRLARGEFETFVSPLVSGYGLTLPYEHFGAHTRQRVVDNGYTAAAAAAERVRAATSDEALIAAVADLHRVLIEDPPAVSLFWQEASRAVGRRVAVPAGQAGDVLVSLPLWNVSP